MVLSPKGEDKYEMKYVPEDFDRYDQGFFGRAKPEYIIVKGECLEKLKQQAHKRRVCQAFKGDGGAD